MQTKLTFLIGCTSCGKGGVGRELALRTGGEIVSLDSMKVYRRMDIGTAKPSADVRRRIPHHLIDVAEPSEEFSAAEFLRHAERAIAEIESRGRPVFVVGGTPLYAKALVDGLFEGPGRDLTIRARLQQDAAVSGRAVLHDRLRGVDPLAATRIHPNDERRLVRALEVFELTGRPISDLQQQWDRPPSRYSSVFLGLRRGREDQNHRINERVRRMMVAGLVDEVRSLLAESPPLGTAARRALGYAEIIQHLEGGLELADAVEIIKIKTRRFAKAQRTWFKRFLDTEWIDLAPDEAAGDVVARLMEDRGTLWSPSPK